MKEFFTGKYEVDLGVWDSIKKEARKHDRSLITVEKFDEQREISNKQMAYLHTVVYPTYGEFAGLSLFGAETVLKQKFSPKNRRGEKLLVKRFDKIDVILSKKVLSVKQTNEWLDNIYDGCLGMNCVIPPPDPEWKKKKR